MLLNKFLNYYLLLVQLTVYYLRIIYKRFYFISKQQRISSNNLSTGQTILAGTINI